MIVLRSTYEALQARFDDAQKNASRWFAELQLANEDREQLRTERATYMAAVEALRDERNHLRDQLAAKDEAILALRREGFDPARPAVPEAERPPAVRLPDDVVRALEARATPGSALWMDEMKRVREELAVGRDPAAIAKEIERGSPLNPYHA